MDRIVASGLLAVSLVVSGHSRVVAQGASPSRPAARPPAQPGPSGKPAAAPKAASSAKFDALVAEAGQARDAKQLDRAVELYKQALAIRPSWDEGQWNLGTAFYELNRFAEARDAFRKVVAAHADNGTAWAFKGLCEFQLKNFDTSLEDLLQARKLPITGGRDVLDVARYHAGILLTRAGQFDQALMILNDFGTQGNESPGVIEAMGLAVLRMPILPADLPGTKRDLVLLAGRARYFQAARLMAGARNAFELLVSRYPDTPNVHYAYGVFLLAEEPDKAIEIFQRELKVSPQNTYAKLQIAFAYIRKGEYDKALPWARDGAAEAPTDYVARHAYGQALLETGDVPAALTELEAGAKLAPDSPIMHFVLAKAYRRAGRTADAEKAQQEFLRLDKLFREARTGSESIGGIPLDAPPGTRTSGIMTLSRTLLRFSRIALLCAAGTSLAAQQPPPQRAVEGEGTNVTAIVVDVVVRDKQGNPIQGLTAGDFQIFEDGVPQDVGSLTAVNKPPVTQPGAAKTVTGAPGEPLGEAAKKAPEVLALVFDRLSADARALAFNAANQYIGQGKVSNNVVAVFGIDLSLVFHQQFTRDADAIRAAIRAAGGRSTSSFNTTRAQVSKSAAELIAATNALNSMTGNAGQGGASSDIGGAAADAQFATIERRMAETFQSLERDEQGYATANALMAVVSAMKAIPGRKSVVFFTEGLAIPPNVKSRFESVIDAANRANVSIYPMDAAGLRTLSTTKETLDGVNEASAVTLARNPTADVSDRPMMMALEKNEDLLRADPHSGLDQLADQTGGFLIANTNDLRNGFQRIDTDMRNYYVLTYVSKNPVYDGKFRTLDVKVKRNDARIAARKGYFALRAPSGAPVLGFEAPALAVLDRRLPNDFPVRAVTLRFPDANRPGLAPVLVTVATSGVKFKELPERKLLESDFIVLARLKDGSGTTIEKLSQRYQIQVPVDQPESTKTHEVLFYREPVLGAGVYTLEAVVYDAIADKASVRIATVDIGETKPEALRVSSLIAVRRVEKVPEAERVAGSPLYVGDQLLTPSMGEPFSKAQTKELPFYFVIYPAKEGTPTATLSLLSAGKPLAEVPLELAAADAKGRIPQVSRIPLEALQPGTYELRVAVKQGTQTAAQGLTFRLTP